MKRKEKKLVYRIQTNNKEWHYDYDKQFTIKET